MPSLAKPLLHLDAGIIADKHGVLSALNVAQETIDYQAVTLGPGFT